MALIVGCCGWTEAQGKYVQDFPTIELQTTFYQPPKNAVAERWRALAPGSFRFCMKAWQLITHTPSSPTYRRLSWKINEEEYEHYGSFRDTDQVQLAWERTREIASILDAQVIVFQCPKSFLPTRENIRNLRRFFANIDRGDRQLAWEPRGELWTSELVRDLCAESNLIHCVDPLKTRPAHGDTLYWRLHGRTGYRYRYTDEDFAEIRALLADHASQEGPDYVMFNNVYSREDALRFTSAEPTPPQPYDTPQPS